MSAAPIAIFAYKRPQALKRMLDSLQRNERFAESPVIVFCDGARSDASTADRAGIEDVRKLAHAIAGCRSLQVVEAPANKGLARSVMEGVSEVVEAHGRVIVIEDDAVLSPFFLRFMNDALDRFAADEQVFSVGSWNYFFPPQSDLGSFFLRYPDSLAWATWKRSWDLFERDGDVLMNKLKEVGRLRALDANGQVRYFSSMLRAQIDGRVDSWAVRWTATCVLHGKVNVYPHRSMSLNKGFGAGATHETGGDHAAAVQLADAPAALSRGATEETPEAIAAWTSYVKLHFEGGYDRSLKTRIWRALPSSVRHWNTRRKRNVGGAPAALAFPPVSRAFGFDRGTPIDRFYIEQFLTEQRASIRGHVMEIAEATYTKQFGTGVTRSEILVFQGQPSENTRVADLTDITSLPAGELDAFICTQTLNFIYEVKKAVIGLHHSLKPGGCALVTVAGLIQISRYDADRWGDFWRFTPQGAQRMFEEVFGTGRVEVTVHGNAYAAACLHRGFAVEECDQTLLNAVDPDYPVVITIKATKT